MKVSGIFYHNVCVPSWQHRKDFTDVLQILFALFITTIWVFVLLRRKYTNEILQAFLPTHSNGWRCDSENDWQVKKRTSDRHNRWNLCCGILVFPDLFFRQTNKVSAHTFILSCTKCFDRPGHMRLSTSEISLILLISLCYKQVNNFPITFKTRKEWRKLKHLEIYWNPNNIGE